MPTYHYRCKNCGYDFTEQQSFNDDPITVCPKCSQEQVRKVYSAVPIEFKGHGFYRTEQIRHVWSAPRFSTLNDGVDGGMPRILALRALSVTRV